jgi:hypothetical protein
VSHAGFDQRIDAWGRLTLVRTGLQRYVGGASFRFAARFGQRDNFSMRLAGFPMPPLADNFV